MKRQPKQPSAFQQIFCTVGAITVLSGVGAIVLANQPNPSAQQSRIFETCNDTWKLGVGAIFGLMGATNPAGKNDDDEMTNF
ncbi:hypothetical protein H6F43_00825 [Leptolyngbya sp. FACHB-36]|uniref:hypothetical protein n=1 Tax=Leptolyngbya sp. FACHB-36 TaxID=2692808 RepID=UPI00167FF39A|nr:hypothetical protein [Leptolyngbya sp. FACHB-36]MBD2018725.1 hypothetical protein [Leptolyngbya sp. FACHB-36]